MGPIERPTFSIMLVAVVALVVLFRAVMIGRLRECHQEVWRGLGSPGALDLSFTDGPSRKATFYLWSGKWIATKDPLMIIFGLLNYLAGVFTLVLFYFQIEWDL